MSAPDTVKASELRIAALQQKFDEEMRALRENLRTIESRLMSVQRHLDGVTFTGGRP